MDVIKKAFQEADACPESRGSSLDLTCDSDELDSGRQTGVLDVKRALDLAREFYLVLGS